MYVNISNIINDFKSKELSLVVCSKDMIDAVLGSLDDRLFDIGCSFYWISDNEISLEKGEECKGYYDNSNLESLLLECYNEYIEKKEIEVFLNEVESSEMFNSDFLNRLANSIEV